LHLLARRGHRVDPDEREEDRRGGRADPRDPEGRELGQVGRVESVAPITMNRTSTPILINTVIVLAVADSREPRISRTAHRTTSSTAGTLT
jgi:hypothetical protein